MQNHLRDIWSAPSRPERPKNAIIGVSSNKRRAVIEQGRRVFDFATLVLPEAAMSHMTETGDISGFPIGFWVVCSRRCFGEECTDLFRKKMKIALNNYLETLRTGASTVDGSLAGRSAKQWRGKGGSLDASKCPELGE